MRLISFARRGAAGSALGSLEGDRVLHLAHAAAILGLPDSDRAPLATMESLLADWERGFPLARSVSERAAASSAPAGLRTRASSRRLRPMPTSSYGL